MCGSEKEERRGEGEGGKKEEGEGGKEGGRYREVEMGGGDTPSHLLISEVIRPAE